MNREPRIFLENRIEEQLKEMREEVNDLASRLDDTEWEPKSDYNDMISRLKLGLDETDNALKRLSAAENAEWKQLREDMASKIDGLGKQLEETKNALRSVLLE